MPDNAWEFLEILEWWSDLRRRQRIKSYQKTLQNLILCCCLRFNRWISIEIDFQSNLFVIFAFESCCHIFLSRLNLRLWLQVQHCWCRLCAVCCFRLVLMSRTSVRNNFWSCDCICELRIRIALLYAVDCDCQLACCLTTRRSCAPCPCVFVQTTQQWPSSRTGS